jgi:hypothetical protein
MVADVIERELAVAVLSPHDDSVARDREHLRVADLCHDDRCRRRGRGQIGGPLHAGLEVVDADLLVVSGKSSASVISWYRCRCVTTPCFRRRR